MEFEAEGNDFGLVDGGQRHDRRVAAPLELEGDGDERIDVAKGADVGENNAQGRAPKCVESDRRYEGNASSSG